MNRHLLIAISLMLCIEIAQGQTTKTVGGTGANYSTLTLAFAAINSGTIKGVIILQITGSTSEASSAVLYGSGTGSASYTSLTIYPTLSGLAVTGSGTFTTPLIDFNGADYVTIDGRVNQSGDANLSVTYNNSSSNSTIRFTNDATNNTVKYCTVKGGGVAIINFSSTNGTTGNDNNTIDHCNITNAGLRPVNAIYSSGSSAKENNGNTISNNNIYNFFRTDGGSSGILIGGYSTDWVISGNSFYETTTPPFVPTGANTYIPINISNSSGNNFMVTGNYIGGQSPQCGGSAWTINASFGHYFCGIYITCGTSTPSTIQNNIVQNINYTSVEDNPWDGIFINAGDVNVIGNTIGATTGTGSVTITTPLAVATTTMSGGVVTAINLVNGGNGYTTAPLITFSLSGSTTPATAVANISGGAVISFNLISGGSGYTSTPTVIFDGQSNNYSTSHGMIQNSPGTVLISGNNIGSITTVGSNYYSHGFESIYVRSVTGTTTFTSNLIGSLTTANSINTSSNAASSLLKQDVYGIYSSGIGTTVITGNTIANLTNSYSGTIGLSRTRGIQTLTGNNTIQNNIVRNISTASAQTTSKIAAPLIGISQTSASAGTIQSVTGNTVYNLSLTNGSAKMELYGILFSGPTTSNNSVSGNFVHSISLLSSNTGSVMDGILLYNGLNTCANNIVNLGVNVTTGYQVNGIWDESGATNNNNIYFNSVYIGGIVSSGVTSLTSALYSNANTSTRDYRNNILYNARSGGSSGKHYAIVIAGLANTTIDYNDYFATGSGLLGRIGTFDKADLTAWKLGTGQDSHSLSINPGFTNPGGASVLDYYASAVLPGVSGTGITTDFDGLTRGNPPKMGALEKNDYVWQGNTSTDFNTATNWTGGAVPLAGADITFASTPSNNCVLDQNRTIGDFTNAQASKKLIVNGKQLTINGNLVFSNGAQIDATATSSNVVFAGTSAQSIPSGAFFNNTADGLTINNSMGLTLNNDFTVVQPFTLANGAFVVGAHTLTLNGVISVASGTLTGGSSSNIIVGGSGTAILPAVLLNNLTLNRSTGLSLGGSVTISGILALTNGTLTLGANTLTISGTVPTRISGNINASNSNATLIFNVPSDIILPASIFTGDVNNLTVSGTGGITASSDFTVNGILNLAGANTSTTKGRLDMWDGSVIKTITMGANATTIGTGDVTGIVKRISLSINTPYSFGNQFTTLNLSAGAALPSSVSIKITLTSSDLSWKPNAIHRYYDIIQSDGTSSTIVTLNLHYLDSELNGATEGSLDLFDYHFIIDHVDDHGHSNYNVSENWVGLGNLELTYIAKSSFNSKYWTIGTSTGANFTWIGASTDWNSTSNWVGGIVPASGNHVVIPDGNTTPFDPVLPATTTIGSISIQAGGIVNGGTGTVLTIDGAAGAWENLGTFNAGASTIVFTNAAATMADPTDFYNVTVANGAKLTLGTDNIMRIAGTLSLLGTGILNAASNNNTIEYNGIDQTVIMPNGPTAGYYNLILSGSGMKTMPGSSLSVAGNFSTSGTATATAGGAMTVIGNITIGMGSGFNTGSFNHSIEGNFENNGTFTAASGNTITMNGSENQSISGTTATTFYNLNISNIAGVNLYTDENVNNTLTLSSGNLSVGTNAMGINGTINKTAGFLDVSSLSSLSFGGTGTITLPSNLFTSSPSINNLSINKSGGVNLGNQNITVNGLLNLTSGTFALGANTCTIAGSSPTRTSGFMDASNASSTLAFTNTAPIVLPVSFFTGNVNNLTINGTGGITASSDFTISGILNLQSDNPSATKGSLDMWDGSAIKTLTMGGSATTMGLGDVTGIVTRTTILSGVTYSFGNEFTTAYFPNDGTLPTEMSAKISIGTPPSWRPGAIAREIEIIQTGGNSTKAIFSFHYLDSELNGNNEEHLVLWSKYNNLEYGRSSYNPVEDWVALSNINVGFFSSSWDGNKNITLDEYSTASTLTWNGSASDSWTSPENWTPSSGPSSDKNIIIPDASTTLHSPTLPAFTEIKTLTIDAAGILNSNPGAQLTINGSSAWNNTGGTFNPSTSNVIFTNNDATISGTTNFYNVNTTIGKVLWLTTGSIMRIAGAMTNNGTWRTVIGGPTIVEYNGGDQTVVVPNVTTNRYSTLILSGSGIKTMPNTALAIYGDFILSGTASVTAKAAITVGGNFTIGTGTSYTAGTYSHSYGAFLIESDLTGTGSLIANSLFSGTVQRYIPNDLKWHFLSSPVSSQEIWPQFAPTPSGSPLTFGASPWGWDFYYWNPNANTASQLYWVNLRQNNAGIFNNWPVDQTGSSAGFGSATPNFTVGRGYLVSYASGYAGSTTHNYTGNLNYGNQSIAITKSDASYNNPWNLVGNPYPSAIDWKASNGWTKVVLANSGYDYWIFNGNAGNYGVYNASTDEGTNSTTRYIAPMQGFFVQANTSGVLSMTSAVQVHSSQTWLKKGLEIDNLLRLKLSTSANSFSDEMIIEVNSAFENGGSQKFWSMYTESPELYSIKEGYNYSIDQLPLVDENSIVAIGIKPGSAATFTLDVSGMDQFFYAKSIVLEDLKTNSTQELKNNPSYTFSANPNDNAERFHLHFGAPFGINDHDNPREFILFSFNNSVFLNSTSGKSLNGELSVYSILGEKIIQKKITENSTRIDLSVPHGCYIATFVTNDQAYSKKLVIHSRTNP